ncbi:MAG: site-specific DNA-methyltransferase [Caldilineaceae bacterium]|nr:site-specific DNA-methyltransferase [Caldilineaceae bacterium]
MATGVPKAQWNEPSNHSQTPSSDLNFSLEYEGKMSEEQVLSTLPANLQKIRSIGKDPQNWLCYGDNLSFLAAFFGNSSIKGKVKLIYIDPPFATNSVFQSRSHINAYQDLLIGSHYIEFVRKRLILLRELLAEDGSIYVHLDDNMAFYIKVIMDEVFGPQNFRNWITRRKCSHKNYTRKTYGNISDYILFYTKSDTYIWNRPVESWTVERARKEYPAIEEGTGRRYKKVPVHAPGIRNGETGQPWRGMEPPPGKHWQYTPKTLDEMDARGEIYWSPTGNPRRKIYLDESAGVPVQDIWYDFRDTRNQNTFITGYPTEKNPDLLDRIIRASSNPGDLVLDCFAGSGTTLAVADRLGRHWIGVDNSAESIRTILHRLTKGTQRMGDYVKRPMDTLSLQQGSLLDLAEGNPEESKDISADPISNFLFFADLTYISSANSIVNTWQET